MTDGEGMVAALSINESRERISALFGTRPRYLEEWQIPA